VVPPRKTVALHVGAHKTGTSLLQAYLESDRHVLAKSGIGVIGRDELGGFVAWGRRLIDEPEALRDHLTRMLEDPKREVVFGSNENMLGRPFDLGGGQLYPAAPKVIAALVEILAPFRPKVLLSLRPQADFLESYYLQSIHQGGHDTFETWYGRLDQDALSWVPIVEELKAAFGADGLEIIDFRVIHGGPGIFLNHILTRIDPAYDFEINFSETRNPSVSEKGLRLALAANPLLQDRNERRAMRIFLRKYFSNVDYPRPNLLSEQQRAELDARYGAEYEALVHAAPPSST
jgi:hypothetical protein